MRVKGGVEREILDVENFFSVISQKVPCRFFEWRLEKGPLRKTRVSSDVNVIQSSGKWI